MDENQSTSIRAEDYRRTLKYLDDLFRSLKFKRRKGLDSVNYVGQFNGRSATVKIHSELRDNIVQLDLNALMPRMITFEVETSVSTRLVILPSEEVVDGALGDAFSSLTSSLQQANNNKQVMGLESEYDQYTIWANDVEWARPFLSDTAVYTLIRPHLYDQSGTLTRNGVSFSPANCNLDISLPPVQITAELITQHLTLLAQLATEAENQPPITQIKQSWIERVTKMDKPIVIVLAVIIGLGIVLPACCGLVFMITRLAQLS